MRRPRDVSDLAASLTAAATTPLMGEAARTVPPPPLAIAAATPKRRTAALDTQQMTLRPRKALVARYVDMAAERSKAQGRTVSAQEVMLEVLEKAG